MRWVLEGFYVYVSSFLPRPLPIFQCCSMCNTENLVVALTSIQCTESMITVYKSALAGASYNGTNMAVHVQNENSK